MWDLAQTAPTAFIAQASDPLAPFVAEPATGGAETSTAFGLSGAWLSLAMVVGGLGLFAAVWASTRRSRTRGATAVEGRTPTSPEPMVNDPKLPVQTARAHPLAESWHALRAWVLSLARGRVGVEPGARWTREGHAQALARQEQRVLSLSRDLEDLTQRLAVEMDAKAARLETLIAEARAAADRLEALDRGPSLEQVARRHAVVTRSEPVQHWLDGHEHAEAPRMVATQAARSAVPVPAMTGVVTGVVTGGRKVEADTVLAADPMLEAAFAGSRPTGEALQSQIARLSAQGLSADQIAHKLGQHVGKVELVLALRRM